MQSFNRIEKGSDGSQDLKLKKVTLFRSPEPKAHGWAYRILMVRRPSVRRLSVRPSTMLKDLLPLNRLANQSQILCGASLFKGNESLYGL